MNKMMKIVSGEMIIGNVISEDENTITLEAPMEVVFRPTQGGQLGINLFPCNPFASNLKEHISFHKIYHVLFQVEKIDQGIENSYIEMTTGIKIPKADEKIVTLR